MNEHSTDDDIERLAAEALLQEAKRAAIRSSEIGAMGWRKCPLPSTNKRFLRNMILKTIEKNTHIENNKVAKKECVNNESFKNKQKSNSNKRRANSYTPYRKK